MVGNGASTHPWPGEGANRNATRRGGRPASRLVVRSRPLKLSASHRTGARGWHPIRLPHFQPVFVAIIAAATGDTG